METILVIDDDNDILGLIKEELEYALDGSLCVITCSTLAQTEEYLAQHTPDFIISDVQVLSDNMQHLPLLGIPIVFYSGRLLDLPPDIAGITLDKPTDILTILSTLFRQAGRCFP